jgi:hemerythrin-like domain-containing protein
MGDVEVKPSGIEGLGLFAARPLRAGARIRRINVVREVTADAPLRPELGERADHCDYPDGRVVLLGSPDRYVNHSCDPSAYELYEGDAAFLVARRDIAMGGEITCDYNINITGGTAWPCHCGAKRCRGETTGDFFRLPPDIQREYRPLLAGWFVRRHRDRLDDAGPEKGHPEMKATAILVHEHEVIGRALAVLDSLAIRLAGGESVPVETLEELIEFFTVFADGCHHAKEEGILFPALKAAGVPDDQGPTALLLEEHAHGRRLIGRLRRDVGAAGSDAEARQRFVTAAREYVALLEQHIAMENEVYFPEADAVLTEAADRLITAAFDRHEAVEM